MSANRLDFACLFVILIWYLGFSFSLIPLTADDIRMAGVNGIRLTLPLRFEDYTVLTSSRSLLSSTDPYTTIYPSRS